MDQPGCQAEISWQMAPRNGFNFNDHGFRVLLRLEYDARQAGECELRSYTFYTDAVKVNKVGIMEHSALIVIDMQNGFLDPYSPVYVPNGEGIIPNILAAITLFRKKSCPIIWIQVNIELFRNTQYQKLFPHHFDEDPHFLSKRSPTYELVDALKAFREKDDHVIEKNRYSAFLYTELELLLRTQLNAENIYFAGVSTNVCVESSLRDAFQLGFNAYLLSDCTATFTPEYQRLSEEMVAYAFGQVVTLEFLKGEFQ